MSTVTREHLAGLKLAHEKTGFSIPVLAELIAQARAAPEQEPVAWMVGKTIWENRSSAVRYGAGRMLLVRPLYSHADDGEVERLRAELDAESKGAEAMLHWKKEADSMRDKLADAQALLLDWNRSLGETMPKLNRRTSAFLSASAQPVECETCGGSQVVATTDRDHEGNSIEIRCPMCDQRADGVKSDE